MEGFTSLVLRACRHPLNRVTDPLNPVTPRNHVTFLQDCTRQAIKWDLRQPPKLGLRNDRVEIRCVIAPRADHLTMSPS